MHGRSGERRPLARLAQDEEPGGAGDEARGGGGLGEAEVEMTNENPWQRAVLRVGDGRGFVVDSHNSNSGPERIVITAAHCLPSFPPCVPAACLEEYTYRDLLGPLDASPAVWAECLFVDPRADVAVLGQSDNQDLDERAEAYNRLMKDMAAFPVAAAPAQGRKNGAGYVLTLDGEWKQGRATLSALRPSVISSPVCRVRPSCRRRAQPSA